MTKNTRLSTPAQLQFRVPERGSLGTRLHGWTHTPINWVSYSTGADLVKLSVAFVTLSDHGDEMSSHPMSAGTESRRT